nr:GNAT family N-acetyltransferase [Micromonospora rhizosphaerae]
MGEPYRRSGYGRAILAAVEAVAREGGATRLGLNVFGHDAPAISLFQPPCRARLRVAADHCPVRRPGRADQRDRPRPTAFPEVRRGCYRRSRLVPVAAAPGGARVTPFTR